MKKAIGPFLVLLFSAVSPAWGQSDIIRLRKPDDPAKPEIRCQIVKTTWKEVTYRILVDGQFLLQDRPAKEIREMRFGEGSKQLDFQSAETTMNSGKYAEAIKRFESAIRNDRCQEPVRQLGRLQIAICHFQDGKYDEAAKAAQACREADPMTYYFVQTYRLQYDAFLARPRPDLAGVERTVQDFARDANRQGVSEWRELAQIMRAELFEYQGKWEPALDIHARYTSGPVTGMDARLGELRCLAELKRWSDLKTKANAILRSAEKEAGGAEERLLIGAYVGRGDAHFGTGEKRDAIFDYLRGALQANRSGESSREHESALAKAAIASCAYAMELKSTDKREEYRQVAADLARDLKRLYPGSSWRKRVEAAISKVR